MMTVATRFDDRKIIEARFLCQPIPPERQGVQPCALREDRGFPLPRHVAMLGDG